MLEFRRQSNDRGSVIHLLCLTPFTALFFAGLVYTLGIRHLPGILISFMCFSAGCYGLVQCVVGLLMPFEHVCIFSSTEVRWFTSNESRSGGQIAVSDVKAVRIDYDELNISFDTGSFLSRGIWAEMFFTRDMLDEIREFALKEWGAVPVYFLDKNTIGWELCKEQLSSTADFDDKASQ